MTPQGVYVLVLAAAALVLFVTEWLAPDLVALLVLLGLGLGNVLDLTTLFSGFGSPVVLTLIGIFMLTSALYHTGVTAYIGQALLRSTHHLNNRLLVGVLSLAASVMALTMNTVAAVALIAPVSRHIALKRDISPSRVLMPVAFGALMGGMATLLTTSNLLMSGLLSDRGLQPFNLLSFLPVGGPIALVGLAYLTVFSQWLMPERSPSDQFGGLRRARQELTKTYRLAMRLHEAYVQSNSPLTSITLAESGLGHLYGVTVSAVVRGRRTYAPPDPEMRLQAGDWLLLQGRPDETEEAARAMRLELFDPDDGSQAVLHRTSSELAEVALTPRAKIIGQTLGDISFREKYGVNVLAVWHEGQPIRSFLSERNLSLGDALLVQAEPEALTRLNNDPDFMVLTHLPEVPEHRERAVVAVAILTIFLVVVAFQWVPISLAALAAGAAVVITRAESMEQARQSIQWQVLFLIAGMLPLAAALERTGVAALMVGGLRSLIGGAGPSAYLLLFYLLTAGLSQFTSGQAATLIAGPLAISAALDLGINPRTLALAVAVGASTAFLSPVSHPANLLVMGPGGYKFSDYAKLGLPLVAIATLGVMILAPLFYPF